VQELIEREPESSGAHHQGEADSEKHNSGLWALSPCFPQSSPVSKPLALCWVGVGALRI
jgi:hypothetical protein